MFVIQLKSALPSPCAQVTLYMGFFSPLMISYLLEARAKRFFMAQQMGRAGIQLWNWRNSLPHRIIYVLLMCVVYLCGLLCTASFITLFFRIIYGLP